MKVAFIILKLITLVSGSTCVFFTGIFYLGSDTQFKEALANEFWTFFLGRFGLCFVIAILFFLVSLLLNLIFRNRHGLDKKKIKQLAFIELSYFFVFSLVIAIFFICSFFGLSLPMTILFFCSFFVLSLAITIFFFRTKRLTTKTNA